MKGRIISNTGPLIALAGIDKLDILKCIFDDILIPLPVMNEIQYSNEKYTGAISISKANWLKVTALSHPPDPLLNNILDEGEASVISLALELKTDWILMDEKKGRKIAADIYGLKVIGTAGFLVAAKLNRHIEFIRPLLYAMRENGYYLHDSIFNWALIKAGES